MTADIYLSEVQPWKRGQTVGKIIFFDGKGGANGWKNWLFCWKDGKKRWQGRKNSWKDWSQGWKDSFFVGKTSVYRSFYLS